VRRARKALPGGPTRGIAFWPEYCTLYHEIDGLSFILIQKPTGLWPSVLKLALPARVHTEEEALGQFARGHRPLPRIVPANIEKAAAIRTFELAHG